MELHINNNKNYPEIIKQAHEIMMHQNGKDVLVGEYRNSSTFSVYHLLALVDVFKRYMEDAIFRSNEDGNGRICHLILAHDFGSCR